MSLDTGHFVISLDYELHWGLFDLKSVNEYQENLKNVSLVITKLLELSDTYNVKLTFATVGFLFAKDKNELIKFSPTLKPKYTKEILDPYQLIKDIGNNEYDDPYHFNYSTLKKVVANKNHEVSTHTYCHYYCNESGQTIEQFEADLNSVKAIAANLNTEVSSIVFPRNMINSAYLDVCRKNGVTSYRGTEKAFIYNIDPKSKQYNFLIFKAQRFLDCIFNLTGHNTYNLEKINNKDTITNLPSSRFLRPFNNMLKHIEPLKIRRITKSMQYAAKNNELFHLWWHPHNFGTHIEENFKALEKIFIEYKKLNKTYNFKSETMSSLAAKVQSELNKQT